ncbi:MAG: catechol 2,3-dioxygenase [Acidimicrobiia bacterium]|jgi:catechol 2,3-dioxygenase|nr:catechol 2,3-dioxygenase [Acidimicrobiia bacterium]
MDKGTGPARPAGVNHLVMNVRDIERSHRFWTDVMGFDLVASYQVGTEMRFYRAGPGHHHDVAIAQVKDPSVESEPSERWRPSAKRAGINHIAIAYPDRDAFLQQLAHLQASGVTFQMRGNHGMTHSCYITDPDGNGIEVLYELPSEVWEGDVHRAMAHYESLPTEGPEALEDRTDYEVFEAHS